MEDEIVFLQPLGGIGLDQRRSGALEFLLDDAGGQALEVGVPNPAAGKLDQLVPVAGEGQLEDHADHAVVEILDVALQAFAAFEDQRFEDFFHRRTLVTDVAGSEVLEAGIGGAGTQDLAQLVEANLLANVELDKNQHGAGQGGVRRLGRHQSGQGLGGNLAYDRGGDSGFAVHDVGA